MKLGDAFPESDFKHDYILNSINQCGSVLREFVKDTSPPKIKRFVVIGYNYYRSELACIYINSEITSYYINNNLINLQYPIFLKDYNIIDHDSYIDCIRLYKKSFEEIFKLANANQSTVLGCLMEKDIIKIKEIILKSKTIPFILKKKYGLFY